MAYYCMDLVVIVQQTGWTVFFQIVAHASLMLPHVLLGGLLSPSVMKVRELQFGTPAAVPTR